MISGFVTVRAKKISVCNDQREENQSSEARIAMLTDWECLGCIYDMGSEFVTGRKEINPSSPAGNVEEAALVK